MAATSDIVLADHGTSNKTFTPAVQVKDGYQYGDTSQPAGNPRTMTVKHIMGNPSSLNAVDVHSVTFAKTVVDDAGFPRTATATLTLRVPHSGVTQGLRLDNTEFIKNFLTDANIAKLEIGGF